jgi:hypothetical protein
MQPHCGIWLAWLLADVWAHNAVKAWAGVWGHNKLTTCLLLLDHMTPTAPMWV